MSNVAIIPQLNLPPALLEQFNALNGANDLDAGVSSGFPVISIRGAKWRIVEGGEERPIYIPNTQDLAPSIKVVLLRSNPAVSKTYYAGQYVEGTDAKPDCYSNDGVTPGADAPHPQHTNCAQCPMNAWGSKISPSGAKIKACADVRRVAILPAEDLEYSPILLRVPAASLGDLAAYGKALKQRGIPYAAVVTKLSFDADAAYPKIMFRFERVLTQEEMNAVAERISDPVVEDVLGLNPARGSAAATAEAQPPADQFGIPADAQAPAQTTEPVATAAEAQAPEQPASATEDKPKRTRSPRKGAFGSSVTPIPDAAEPAAQTEPVAEQTTAMSPAGVDDVMGDLDKALAAIQF
ncbi:hypothetical protein [Candidimonas nitroreducens]|uniref:Uncharacterized protein n=1 Tax=Candidimonas nitroreducens TaxID=683354 RepID=A0A225LVS2_9BURK|nr:hypothetical protein [Candidimonas nitroreducens]OWT53388.1 hypothetical protein CEY11_24860 [Candidimonas nitroreducens]